MDYNQEYNELPVYELNFQYAEDSESDTIILQNLYRSYVWDAPKSNTEVSHRALCIRRGGEYSSGKSLAPLRGQCHQPWVGVPPLPPSRSNQLGGAPYQKLIFSNRLLICRMDSIFTSTEISFVVT